jgi:beta-1,4-N-acetylglucosaminyltransferase
MIFVTVGTTHFDDLIREVDRLLECGVVRDRVYAQIGSGSYVPRHAEWVRYLENIRQVEEEADLVICHGGVGSVFELLYLDKDFIAVPNPELPDGHQAELLSALIEEGWCTCCFDLRDLGALIADGRTRKPYPKAPQLPGHIWSLVTSVNGLCTTTRPGARCLQPRQ